MRININGNIICMELTRAYKFRIYPDVTRQEEIDERLILAQQLYNKILEKSIASYQNGKTKVSMSQFNRFVKEIIQEDKKYLKLYSQTRCEIEYRLLKAYQNFFRRIKEGNKKALFLSLRLLACPSLLRRNRCPAGMSMTCTCPLT